MFQGKKYMISIYKYMNLLTKIIKPSLPYLFRRTYHTNIIDQNPRNVGILDKKKKFEMFQDKKIYDINI